MKNNVSLMVVVMVLCICLSMLTACNNNLSDPDQGHNPSSPTDTAGGDVNDPTGSSQEQTPTNPENNDSNIMDGEDHIEMPFG